MHERIYKVVSRGDWLASVEIGIFGGASIDLRDGYIHFSTRDQLATTLELHFTGQSDLVLVEVDVSRVADQLKWEPSRGGELFPHLYGVLRHDAVGKVFELHLDQNGRHVIPC